MSRDPIGIQYWLIRRGIQQKAVAREIGLSEVTVSRTIRGRENNRRVLRHLLNLGVPTDLLDLPLDMRKAA